MVIHRAGMLGWAGEFFVICYDRGMVGDSSRRMFNMDGNKAAASENLRRTVVGTSQDWRDARTQLATILNILP